MNLSQPYDTYDHEVFDSQMANIAFRLSQTTPQKFGKWQATDVSASDAHDMHELLNVGFSIGVPTSALRWKRMIHPNLPWADEHFRERVSGAPMNPGESYKNWPWYKGGVEDHKQTGIFSHTYMERYWPKWAGDGWQTTPAEDGRYNKGIRWAYGDLGDVITLLEREPLTRQAYLPVWFPEDTGAVHGERVPCSLGYHFMIRDNELHCWYAMRSCDFIRYLRDDIYLTGALMQYIVDKLNADKDEWDQGEKLLSPGTLHMTISSLHCFRGDAMKLDEVMNGKFDWNL